MIKKNPARLAPVSIEMMNIYEDEKDPVNNPVTDLPFLTSWLALAMNIMNIYDSCLEILLEFLSG